jgi:NAD(P)-dependent dehydrogenase (short-subunit alcohol dehydrogenase family)
MAQAWDQLFAINLRAAMLVTRAVLPIFEHQQFGRILVISPGCGAGHLELPFVAAMTALEAMWAVWGRELRAINIMVNVLARTEPPGSVGEERGRSSVAMLGSSNVGSPARWLLSREAEDVSGYFIDAALWREDLPSGNAARIAARLLRVPSPIKRQRPFDVQDHLPRLRADFFKFCKGD